MRNVHSRFSYSISACTSSSSQFLFLAEKKKRKEKLVRVCQFMSHPINLKAETIQANNNTNPHVKKMGVYFQFAIYLGHVRLARVEFFGCTETESYLRSFGRKLSR